MPTHLHSNSDSAAAPSDRTNGLRMQTNVYGNPHSANPSSTLTSERIEEARDLVLQYFNADPAHYQVVFTKSTTGALQTIGETFPWQKGSVFRCAHACSCMLLRSVLASRPAAPGAFAVAAHACTVCSRLCSRTGACAAAAAARLALAAQGGRQCGHG